MNPETFDKIIKVTTLLAMSFAVIGSVTIIGTAVYQTLVSRRVRWDALLFALVLLWSLPYGIRVYGPELFDASIDLLNSLAGKREPMENAIRSFVGDDLPSGGEAIITTPDQPQATPTPWPTPAIDFEATATAFFEGLPTQTPLPAPTMPLPTQTPLPTRCTYTAANGLQMDCPPTPQPGG